MSVGHPLTEEQICYIRKNFSNMRNQDLAAALGISCSAVCRVQKRFGLRKSKEHNTLMGRKAGKASFVARGGVALGLTPEVLAKRVESYKKTMREERARVLFGLEQKTKMRVKRQPRAKCSKRSYLKKMGYILDEANVIAYYTPETHRAVRMEKQDRKKTFYSFREYKEQPIIQQ